MMACNFSAVTTQFVLKLWLLGREIFKIETAICVACWLQVRLPIVRQLKNTFPNTSIWSSVELSKHLLSATGSRQFSWGSADWIQTQSLVTDRLPPPLLSLSLYNRGGERRWPQNKAGVVHRYQATVICYCKGMGIDGVGSFPGAGGCDDSEESGWPTATTRSKQFR